MCREYNPLVEMERISFGMQAARTCWKNKQLTCTEPEHLWAQNSEPVATSSLFTPEVTLSIYQIHNCCGWHWFFNCPMMCPCILNQLMHENEAPAKKRGGARLCVLISLENYQQTSKQKLLMKRPFERLTLLLPKCWTNLDPINNGYFSLVNFSAP